MLGASVDAGHNHSDHAGTVLIPTKFVWSHGGRRVFLIGSFTGWSEHIPMSPVEGCPTVFQVLCNLTPGYHQFKFNVDGEWRHDERQNFVSGSYGIVNTVFLASDSECLVPVAFNTETPGRSNMEVDDTLVRLGISDSILSMDVPKVSEADIDVCRHRISLFLSQHTAYELLPESGKVVALDVNLPVKQAFHIFYEQGISVAPLWDFCKGHFVGVLSAIDFILILREIGNNRPDLTEEELETHSILAWKDEKSHILRNIDGNGGMYSKELIHAGPYDSLKDVALTILQNKVSIVPIIHSSSPDGSFPQLLHLASLSGILKCICRHFKHFSSALPILQQPICSIPLGTWVPRNGEIESQAFAMLRQNASFSAALSLLVQVDVSSIPIVDDSHSLIDIYSRSDITSLAKDRAYAQICLDEMSIHQMYQNPADIVPSDMKRISATYYALLFLEKLRFNALQLAQDSMSSSGIFNGQRCHMCLRSDTLHKVMESLANPGVRRLVIVEAGSKRVEGIVTLSDVFRFLLG